MKAVLVIDVPEKYMNENLSLQGVIVNQVDGNVLYANNTFNGKFMPLPKKKNTDFHPNIVYANGWNDCLKAITGEEEMENTDD